MEFKHLPNTDTERLQALKHAYQKAMTTPKEELAFSTDMLKYLKPFITKLNNEIEHQKEQTCSTVNGNLLRQVIDELLCDIWDEVENTYSSCDDKNRSQMISEYGITYEYGINSNASYSYLDNVA